MFITLAITGKVIFFSKSKGLLNFGHIFVEAKKHKYLSENEFEEEF